MPFERTFINLLGPYGEYLAEVAAMAAVATVLGELTLAVGYRVNHQYLKRLTRDLIYYQRLSDQAEKTGDTTAYQAVNKEGNEVWGKLFFHKVALSAAALWPIFFALAWLQSRYATLDLPVPGTPLGLNYVVVFLFAYVGMRLLFSRISRRLPFFRTVLRLVDDDAAAYSETDPRTQR
ncbi:MAG: hypothetical protein ACUVWY_01850 [Desulfosoma sp.]|uniref:hypothetical protein n=1 Tax=Desulfosoma sp. TaxID=2603217 RepID=UPI004049C907